MIVELDPEVVAQLREAKYSLIEIKRLLLDFQAAGLDLSEQIQLARNLEKLADTYLKWAGIEVTERKRRK